MKLCLTIFFLVTGLLSFGQPQNEASLETWQKAVVNIETESFIYPKHVIDSVLASKRDSGLSRMRMDSIRTVYMSTTSWTGTAIYAKYKDRKYLVTARHVLLDEVLVDEMSYENSQQPHKWPRLEAIYPKISIRTPLEYYEKVGHFNDLSVMNNNFVPGPKPFYFISDSSGDGIGIISLQASEYKALDTMLQRNDFAPIPLEQVCAYGKINVMDTVVNIGYPEMVSVAGRVPLPSEINLTQSRDLVVPFFVAGRVAMYSPFVQYFYADITTSPGSSGSPIIKKGKLIGLVSGSNKYKILDDKNIKNANLYSIGHYVQIVSTSELCRNLNVFRHEEDQLMKKEKENN